MQQSAHGQGSAYLRGLTGQQTVLLFDGIAALVRNARLAVEAGDAAALGRCFDLAQMLLAGLMVSCEEVETMCRLAREAGALGAKLTGAGGGGCVVAIVEHDATPVLDAWARLGFSGFATEVAPREEAAT